MRKYAVGYVALFDDENLSIEIVYADNEIGAIISHSKISKWDDIVENVQSCADKDDAIAELAGIEICVDVVEI